ncbi:tRNA 5-methoxyuridine(34)/uridine 5-oxyacetic acid(34) synthase CmoB [Candidatus Spongiihabitans sp.]|uniref:tRNA 5-methoxyuridine(34)/uridine 5-oxyacetic acid(34) synthase CmoB n=1 Tax=Candidatus Spongiihabitans sp. TaxID=3101308 RepID=UPI003C6F73F4
MIQPETLRRQLRNSPLESMAEAFIHSTISAMNHRRHGDLDKWVNIIDALPEACPSVVELDQAVVKIGRIEDMDADARDQLKQLLLELQPWRKGPFEVFGILVDSEWRSNIKWGRLESVIRPLKDRLILDVGCGNGYYMLRMLGAGARYVLGIEPCQLFIAQYNALQKCLSKKYEAEKYETGSPSSILPLRCEEIPFDAIEDKGIGFDTVFSMGVLYHRKKPMAHLAELARCLKPGGELVMETLIINGDAQDILVPKSTYAKMSNIWCIPSELKLQEMLSETGFKKITTVDITATRIDEQRRTQWMTFESLSDFLDSGDQTKTIEGYPAPLRIVVTCVK